MVRPTGTLTTVSDPLTPDSMKLVDPTSTQDDSIERMPEHRISSQYVRWGPSNVHGVGVFALGDFAIDDIIEVCHYKRLAAIMQYHPLFDTVGNAHLVWPRDMHGIEGKNGVHIPTGLSLLYNHADNPNAHFRFDLAAKTLTVTATQPIFNYDEVFIDYRRTHPKKVKGF